MLYNIMMEQNNKGNPDLQNETKISDKDSIFLWFSFRATLSTI